MKNLTSFLLCFAFAGSAHAAIYSCKDASGKTFASDHPLAECMGQPTRELSAAGVTVRTNERPLTAEQVRKQAEDRKRDEEAERAQREARRRDQALLASYKDADAIERTRARSLKDAERMITTSEAALATLMKDQQGILAEVKEAHGKVGPALQRRVDDNALAVASETKTIAANRADVDRINQRFDETAKRFQALNGGH